MAALPSTAFLPATSAFIPQKQLLTSFDYGFHSQRAPARRLSLTIHAAKLPAGVEMPKVEPKFKPAFLGFTNTAEIWNSRACMMGLIGTFIVELIMNKGILQLIGIEIGKGLDLPL